MSGAVNEGIFPSAQLLVVSNNEILHHTAYGNATLDTIYDIASLTKAISTTMLSMILVAEDKIRLDDSVSRHFTKYGRTEDILVRHLLNHSTGLPKWVPYYQTIPTDNIGKLEGRSQIIDSICSEPLLTKPGYQSVYSDLDFIILGEVIESVANQSLDKLFDDKIAGPLGLKNTFYVPLNSSTAASFDSAQDKQQHPSTPLRTSSSTIFAPTEDCPWRKKVMQGEVHDQNCYAMGGIAGHSGLFSNTTDINIFLKELVACYEGIGNFIAPEVIQRFFPFKDRLTECNSTWLLGWDRPSYTSSQAGNYFSPKSIGHLGYTGCSMWVDLDKDFWIVLLTNRNHPTITNEKIKQFRPIIYNQVYEELIA